jgi:nicotinamidase-related amidase
MRNNILFVIDPQNSFMGHINGRVYQVVSATEVETAELPVAGAVDDMDRLVRFIDSDGNGEGIDDIVLTLDTHEWLFKDRDIGHAHYWKSALGAQPDPFTVISFDDIVNRKWMPFDPELGEQVLNYFSKIDTQMVWPRHCILGTWGHDIYDPLNKAIARWTNRTGNRPWPIKKGMNCHTEQYGAFEAAVPDKNDPTTEFNWTLLNHLKKATCVWVAGEAKSHCVKVSVEQAVAKLSATEIAQWTLLEDCMSCVPGFEADGENFIAEMLARGMQIAKTAV